MSDNEEGIGQTQHALLVAWGQFAQEIGLVAAIESVNIKQKRYIHTPQTKVLEFFVAHLAGLKHLQEISLSAHPLDKDEVVAQAWGQTGWADYSGISRTLSGLSWAEVHEIVRVLEKVSQPFVDREVQHLRASGQKHWYDGDLSGLPVSSDSTTFPNATFGHMANEVQLGYQAAVVTLLGVNNRRLWLSVAHHSGNTVSSTQAKAMVEAAEARTGLRPRRRTELLGQRIQALAAQQNVTDQRRQKQQTEVTTNQRRLVELAESIGQQQQTVEELEKHYEVRQRLERPTSHLTKARQQYQRLQQKEARLQTRQQAAVQRLTRTEALYQQQESEITNLRQWLAQLEQDNVTNPEPITAVFRFDAGFGSYENLALLIEMGYELYTKPYSHKVTKYLHKQLPSQPPWTQVGKNAQMVAWADYQLKGCPYSLNVALQRFQTSKSFKYSVLLHFGDDPVTEDLPAWFDTYNGRQIIEAAIKEGKQVFHLHRIKVRSEPAIFLQEQFVILAANFIRWATQWLAENACPLGNSLDVTALGVKRQVQVAAHASADVLWDSDGWLLRFSQHSVFAGKVLKLSTSSGFLMPQKNLQFLDHFL